MPLFLMSFLTCCKTTTVINSCNLPLQRLSIIEVDCHGKSQGSCMAEALTANKQHNQDKQAIITLNKDNNK